jgi:hypothetical protein
MADCTFVVIGTTGEFSDREEWLVCAYPTEEQAQTHVQLAEARARALGLHDGGIWDWCELENLAKKMVPYDSPPSVYCTGLRYAYAEVPVFSVVPGREEDPS